MKIYLCVDDHCGLMFNHRRQSRDRVVISDIIENAGTAPIYMSEYSASLFSEYENKIISDDFLSLAGVDDLCFVEDRCLSPYKTEISELVIYRWNRTYPADFWLDLKILEPDFKLISSIDLVGYSHEKITREVYINATENTWT